MSVPENECPHLDTRVVLTYGWKTTCCVDCGAEWRVPTTAKTAPAAQARKTPHRRNGHGAA